MLALALLMAAQCVRIAIPWLFGCAVNELQAGGSEGLRRAGGFLVLILGAALVAWAMHGPARIIERRTARERMADALLGRLLALPLRWHERYHTGDVLHRLQKTTTALFGFAQNQFIYLQNIVSVVGPIAALFAVSLVTGGAALVRYAIIGLVLVCFDRVMVRLVREENAAERRYTSSLVDAAGNISTVLTLGLHEPIRALVRGRHLDVSRPLSRSIVVNEAKWATIDLFNNAMRVGLVALYGWLVYAPKIGRSIGSGAATSCASVSMPSACSRTSETGPMPGSLRTGSGASVAASVPALTSSTPCGFASPLATFAIGLLVAMPALAGSPSSRSIAWVISRTTRKMVASASASPGR